MIGSDVAERLFDLHHHGTSKLLVGRLPDRPDVELPLPPGAQVIGSYVSGSPDLEEPDSIHVYADVDGSRDDVLRFYDSALGGAGFKAAEMTRPAMGYGGGGFMPAPGPVRGDGRLYCRGRAGPFYQVRFRRDGEGLVLALNWNAGLSGFTPCDRDARRGMPPGMEELPELPTLVGPPGVAVRGGGGGGGPQSWSSYGWALTPMSATELHDHFSSQIATQPYTLIDKGSAERVAWSRWKAREADRRVFLLVFEQSEKVRHLELVTTTPAAERNLRRYEASWSSFLG